jgi:hypothetical protein
MNSKTDFTVELEIFQVGKCCNDYVCVGISKTNLFFIEFESHLHMFDLSVVCRLRTVDPSQWHLGGSTAQQNADILCQARHKTTFWNFSFFQTKRSFFGISETLSQCKLFGFG